MSEDSITILGLRRGSKERTTHKRYDETKPHWNESIANEEFFHKELATGVEVIDGINAANAASGTLSSSE